MARDIIRLEILSRTFPPPDQFLQIVAGSRRCRVFQLFTQYFFFSLKIILYNVLILHISYITHLHYVFFYKYKSLKHIGIRILETLKLTYDVNRVNFYRVVYKLSCNIILIYNSETK